MASMRIERDKDPTLQNLSLLFTEAIDQDADCINLEWVREGLEVTYIFGNTGLGKVIEDRRLAGSILKSLIKQAKLERKSRGVIEWVHRGKTHKIHVSEYESFGETCFRVVFKKSRRSV